MLKTNLGNVQLSSCLFNAAGPKCVTKEELDILLNVDSKWSGGVVSKSMTVEQRDGNLGKRYVDTPWGSINSMGLPNEGYEFYLNYYREVVKSSVGVSVGVEDCKEMILSVSGLSVDDNIFILRKINDMGRELMRSVTVELNLSCPNIAGKAQLGYDFDAVKELLWKIRRCNFIFITLGVKLPPYFDMSHFSTIGKIIMNNRDLVRFVVCINSIGNGLVVDSEKEETVIAPKKGFGGIGGDYVLPTALANVRMFYKMFNGGDGRVDSEEDVGIDIIGVGGVRSGEEAFQHILCGAKAVQIGTCLMKEGEGVFERVGMELEEIMKRKGYTCLEDFRGKLKEI